jgi:4-amino-4-deoxy-L-arabinose transferase-like glycosyltransferase
LVGSPVPSIADPRVGPWAALGDLLLLALVCALVFLYRLGDLPINLWDEARVAMNALEMRRSGELLITTYKGLPDLWNTKPPLAIWLEAGSMWLFGDTEFALRLPSALAGAATTILVYAFTRRVSGSRAAGILAALVLMACPGYVGTHVTRSADYDTLLVLFTTAMAFSVWLALEDRVRISRRWLVVAAVAMALAILTKGIAGLMLLPGLALYVLLERRVRDLVANPVSWACVAIAIAPALAFYAVRESALPGYALAVFHNELGARFLHQIAGVPRPWWYYLYELASPWPWRPVMPYPATGSAFPWSVLLSLTAWATLTSPRQAVRRAGALCGVTIVVYLAVISAAATRVVWYAAPVYPLLAALSALALQRAWEGSRFGLDRFPTRVRVGAAIAATALLVLGVVVRDSRVIDVAPLLPETQSASFVRDTLVGHPALAHVRIIHDGYASLEGAPYTGPEDFYAELFDARDVSVVHSGYRVRSGETLVWCDGSAKSPVIVRGVTIASAHRCRAVRISDD